MRVRGLIIISTLLIAAAALSAAAQERRYIRDEIRVNMRAGPGLQFRIVRVLTSGEVVRRIAERDDWVQVAIPGGPDGWIESGYVTSEVPPSVVLPQLQDQLTHAEARVRELERKLGVQTEAITELEELRAENEGLEATNADLEFSSGWQDMAAGAGIMLVGMVIGLLGSRGTVRSGRKIKL